LPLVLHWGIVGAAYAVLFGAVAKAVLVTAWYLGDVRAERLRTVGDS